MKGYVVTLTSVPESVNVAVRCIESAKKFNIDVTIFNAVTKDNARKVLNEEALHVSKFDETWSNTDAVLANFASQYQIWKMVARSGQPAIVLEHDAVFVGPIPPLLGEGDIINLGKPSYGKFNTPKHPGVYPMFSKDGGYIPGAHGYVITPLGARELMEQAFSKGAAPCDLFLNKKNFPSIREMYPWPIEAHDSFSTIQKTKGCTAKHNYNKEYKLL